MKEIKSIDISNAWDITKFLTKVIIWNIIYEDLFLQMWPKIIPNYIYSFEERLYYEKSLQTI